MNAKCTNEPAKAARAAQAEPTARLIGESMPIQSLRRTIGRVAATDAPVLITGESGTGKELVARMIHAESRRASGPLVTVNCPALAPELFHAEVFGYEKGAYTGAWKRNVGRIEAAEGGTLFLDEIGDLSPETQVVLLRFLQEGTFERLGSNESIVSDARIIAATHVDLETALRKGSFREDLYYRLKALHLHVPPLRDRGGDIRLLAQHFIDQYCDRLGLRPHSLARDAIDLFSRHAWPGNVRELRHNVLQAVVMCESAEISAFDLGLGDFAQPGNDDDVSGSLLTLAESRENAECRAIQQALRAFDGDVCAAARRLAISRAQLYRLIKRHGLETRPR
ncbi:MAG: sigma-54-dependent Fis family transcriptional regulator [Wenzhouxiangellaceae bacterium]|nr:sigma-54-dependent Fis family transcriptional regulator [Wenzhouxiangellaceae bacterium]